MCECFCEAIKTSWGRCRRLPAERSVCRPRFAVHNVTHAHRHEGRSDNTFWGTYVIFSSAVYLISNDMCQSCEACITILFINQAIAPFTAVPMNVRCFLYVYCTVTSVGDQRTTMATGSLPKCVRGFGQVFDVQLARDILWAGLPLPRLMFGG